MPGTGTKVSMFFKLNEIFVRLEWFRFFFSSAHLFLFTLPVGESPCEGVAEDEGLASSATSINVSSPFASTCNWQIWNWLKQLPHSTQLVHCHQTVSCCFAWCINDGRTDPSSAAVSWRHHEQEMLSARFQETTQSEQHWHSKADMEGFICSKLKIINECTSRSNMP